MGKIEASVLAAWALFCCQISLLAPGPALAQHVVAMAAINGKATPSLPDGPFDIFVAVTGDQGGIYHNWQNGSGWQSSWTLYTPTPDNLRYGLVAAHDGIGRIVCAWISKGNIVAADEGFVGASLFNTPAQTVYPIRDPDGKTYNFIQLTIATNSIDGTVEILALNSGGRVYSLRESVPTGIGDGKPWAWQSGLKLVGGGDVKEIALTRHGAGLALAGLGGDGKAYVKLQSTPGAWDPDPWINLGGDKLKDVYAADSIAHQLEVVARDNSEHYILSFQSANSSIFSSGWLSLATSQKFSPNAFFGQFQDGSLFVASHLDAGKTYEGSFGKVFQNPGNGGWPVPDKFAWYWADDFPPQSSEQVPQDDLRYLNPQVWAVAADANHFIHYFANVEGISEVDHFVDKSGASIDPSTHQIDRTLMKFEAKTVGSSQTVVIPNLPWKDSK